MNNFVLVILIIGGIFLIYSGLWVLTIFIDILRFELKCSHIYITYFYYIPGIGFSVGFLVTGIFLIIIAVGIIQIQ